MELGELNASCVQMFHMLFSKMQKLEQLPDILRVNTPNTNHDKPKLALWMRIGTFTYNCATGKTNLPKYVIRSKQPFIMVKDDAFTDYIRIIHNPYYEPISRNTIRSKIFRVFKE